ncbi:MAG TPA: SpoIID/LytB domain-containing protein [Myxococcota bacterium]
MLAFVLALFTALPLVTSSPVPASSPLPPEDETVRIAVGRFNDSVVIEASELVVRRLDGGDVKTAKRSTKLALGRAGLVVDGVPTDRDVLVVNAELLTLAKHSYRGALEVRLQTFKGRRELLVVHPLDLETYVTGIVSAELPRGWPLGAYQAQAVAARTFAVTQKYRRLDLPYHMESSVLDQVYAGVGREHALADEAARTTRGLVLGAHRHLAQTYFHAACGGSTESAAEGWGSEIDYLPGSACNHCGDANRANWQTTLRRADVDKAFRSLVGGPVISIRVVGRTASGRTKLVELKSAKKKRTITGADFRRLLGWSVVWSTQIDKLTLTDKHLVVVGRGSGHGVGLCQWGARGFALEGVAWEEILRTYYPGADLVRLY